VSAIAINRQILGELDSSSVVIGVAVTVFAALVFRWIVDRKKTKLSRLEIDTALAMIGAKPNDILKDWLATSDVLFQDVMRAAEALDNTSDPYGRRNYVRAVFAAIEGSTYGLKRVVLQVQKQGGSNLKTNELERLIEPEMVKGGKIKKRYLPFDENIKFTFKTFAKAHGFSCPAVFEVSGWTSLLKAVKIRDGLMHPKCSGGLNVSDQDLDVIQKSSEWYFTTRDRLVESATAEFRKKLG
jgi:hypothetical protein